MLELIVQTWTNRIWPNFISGNLMIVAIIATFALLLIYETLHPKEKHPSLNLQQSYKTNIGMFIVNAVTLSVLSASSLLLMIDPTTQYGIFNFVSNNHVKIVLSFLALDWLLYYWHKTCHKYNWLWMFHRVHHNDTHLNVSTAFRVHFIELFFTNILKVSFVITMGIDQVVLMFHELITTLFVMFHHSNIEVKYESILGKMFVSPSIHRTHHSIYRKEHDNNYGAIFSIWDRIYGTFLNPKPVKTGIQGEYSPQELIDLIKFGFTTPVIPIRVPKSTVPLNDMIQVAAYYRAEKRGFAHGNDHNDWYAAEKEIHKMLCNNDKKVEVVVKQNPKFKWFNFQFFNKLSLC